nr:MAG TPA: hypothetical protein [Caudoviricetes sp.]
MKKKYAEIINEGKATGKTIEAINAELEAAGANFYLAPDGRPAGWSEDEMREGFVPAEKEPEDAKHLHDVMRYDTEKAGETLRIQCAEGVYDVTWDVYGHPEKAVRVHG